MSGKSMLQEREPKRRVFSSDESDFVREHYIRSGANWCSARLRNRSAGSVRRHAKRIGVARVKADTARPSNDMIDAVIRRYYTGARPRGFVKACAKQVGRHPHWVSKRAVNLGLVQSRDQRVWTQEELDYVSRNSMVALRDMSRRMARLGWKRTPSAIAYVRREGMAETSDTQRFTAAGLGEAMGTTTSTVVGWIKRGILKAGRRGWDRTEAQKGDGYVIHERDVAKFALQYPAHYSLAKLEPNKFWFLDLLARYAKPVSATNKMGAAA